MGWSKIAAQFSTPLKALVQAVKDIAGALSEDLFKLLEVLAAQDTEVLLDAMNNAEGAASPYGDEIRGIAAAAGITKLDALIANLVYEIAGACTAIIGQDDDGHVVHGHNLDTAAILNFTTGQWELAQKLRDITTNVHFKKGGQIIYNATTYAGYAGIFEGMKAGAFSVSVNTRFDTTLYQSLRRWITGADRTGQFGTLLVRDALELDATFDDAVQRLDKTKLMGPAYYAIAGTEPLQGAIMSRNYTTSMGFWRLKDELNKGHRYMVQTNYDHWDPDPFFDKRRKPAQKCMDGIKGDINIESLHGILSAKPNRNKMTCHTALFSARTGTIESYQQYCFEKGCRLFETEETIV